MNPEILQSSDNKNIFESSGNLNCNFTEADETLCNTEILELSNNKNIDKTARKRRHGIINDTMNNNEDTALALAKKQKIKNKKKENLNKNKGQSYYGEMDYFCQYCKAAYWKIETHKTNCCQKGTNILPPYSKYDDNMKKLLLHDSNYRRLIRYYNNLFSFATFNANVIQRRGKGVYNLTIYGQVCYSIPKSVMPVENEEPK